MDTQLYPKGHPLYDVMVFDKLEQRVYNRSTDLYLSVEETIVEMQNAVERFTVLESSWSTK